MFGAFTLSVDQLGDRAVLGVIAKSLIITLMLFGGLGVLAYFGIEAALAEYGYSDREGWVAATITAIIWVLAFILLFRAVAVPVIGFFADEVVAAVERKHFPALAKNAQAASFGLSIRLGLMSVLRLLLVNLMLLPVYAALLLTAIGPFALFLLANAVLLGRDLGEMVAVRHLDKAACKQWLAESRWSRALLGLLITAMFMVPIVNIFAPIIGAAMATHIFHRANPSVTRNG